MEKHIITGSRLKDGSILALVELKNTGSSKKVYKLELIVGNTIYSLLRREAAYSLQQVEKLYNLIKTTPDFWRLMRVEEEIKRHKNRRYGNVMDFYLPPELRNGVYEKYNSVPLRGFHLNSALNN